MATLNLCLTDFDVIKWNQRALLKGEKHTEMFKMLKFPMKLLESGLILPLQTIHLEGS